MWTFESANRPASLRNTLDELNAAGEALNFILIDADHSADGVRRDIETIMGRSGAASRGNVYRCARQW